MVVVEKSLWWQHFFCLFLNKYSPALDHEIHGCTYHWKYGAWHLILLIQAFWIQPCCQNWDETSGCLRKVHFWAHFLCCLKRKSPTQWKTMIPTPFFPYFTKNLPLHVLDTISLMESIAANDTFPLLKRGCDANNQSCFFYFDLLLLCFFALLLFAFLEQKFLLFAYFEQATGDFA